MVLREFDAVGGILEGITTLVTQAKNSCSHLMHRFVEMEVHATETLKMLCGQLDHDDTQARREEEWRSQQRGMVCYWCASTYHASMSPLD
jgi:hypothetical protein